MKTEHVVFAVVLFTVLFLTIMTAASFRDVRVIKAEAIERGFAEYNSTTGVWQWKEKK